MVAATETQIPMSSTIPMPKPAEEPRVVVDLNETRTNNSTTAAENVESNRINPVNSPYAMAILAFNYGAVIASAFALIMAYCAPPIRMHAGVGYYHSMARDSSIFLSIALILIYTPVVLLWVLGYMKFSKSVLRTLMYADSICVLFLVFIIPSLIYIHRVLTDRPDLVAETTSTFVRSSFAITAIFQLIVLFCLVAKIAYILKHGIPKRGEEIQLIGFFTLQKEAFESIKRELNNRMC